jgi:hypothetical protein
MLGRFRSSRRRCLRDRDILRWWQRSNGSRILHPSTKNRPPATAWITDPFMHDIIWYDEGKRMVRSGYEPHAHLPPRTFLSLRLTLLEHFLWLWEILSYCLADYLSRLLFIPSWETTPSFVGSRFILESGSQLCSYLNQTNFHLEIQFREKIPYVRTKKCTARREQSKDHNLRFRVTAINFSSRLPRIHTMKLFLSITILAIVAVATESTGTCL